jgi:hypothetical protein
MIRALFIFSLCLGVVGCRSTKEDKDGQSAEVKPVQIYTGKIALVKANLKYVVVDGELGAVPPAQTMLGVYRGENKVGEIKVSPQIRANNYAADIVSGAPQVGDTVRSN